MSIHLAGDAFMSTNNPKINVTFEPKLNEQISLLAAHEHKSVSKLIEELVIEALETREDIYLSNVAENRDIQDQKTASHKDVWKKG